MSDNGYKEYTTVMGDMWDSIAYKLYRDCTAATEIMELNPTYRHYAIFPAGIKLTVPTNVIKVTAAANTALPPWRRGMS